MNLHSLAKSLHIGMSNTVTGLLMANNLSLQFREAYDLGNWIVLPWIGFDHPESISPDHKSPRRIAQTLNQSNARCDRVVKGKNPRIFETGIVSRTDLACVLTGELSKSICNALHLPDLRIIRD
jgi:hypothetical protein